MARERRWLRHRGSHLEASAALALSVAVLVGLAIPLTASASTTVNAAETLTVAGASTINVTGHGWGHGRGMGQFGALGYALNFGWTYQQILSHFYGGTVSGTAPTNSTMTVDMTGEDGQDTIVAQSNGMLSLPGSAAVSCAPNTPCSVRVVRTGPQKWSVYQGTACNGGTAGWKLTAATVSGATVPITSTMETTQNPADMLELCEASGIRWLRGDIWAVDTGSSQATVNSLPLESYVQGVVPNESPDGWAALGNGAGEQELMAQAVAARSYALADTYAPYAKTCDTTQCQVYGGRAFQPYGGTFTDLEGTAQFAGSDQATTSTAGQIRVFAAGGGGPAGVVALTEFSSSTGGYTAGGVFPAVVDAGDAVASNPNHTWTTQVPVTAIESAYGSDLGALLSITVTGRNGDGDLGGRVTTLTLQFAGGQANATGNGFAAALGLKSNWFAFVGAGGQTSSTGTPAPGPAPIGPSTVGYDVLTTDGAVHAFNGAPAFGTLDTGTVGTTPIALAPTPGGYDMLGASGGIYIFGASSWYGSMKSQHLGGTPVALMATPDGKGYWIVTSNGGVYTFGDAPFHGSAAGMHLGQPIVAAARTGDGAGYWLMDAVGGIFTFGDAAFNGSGPGLHIDQPFAAMAPTPDGRGYWLMDTTGGIFTFGDAPFHGSLPGIGVNVHASGVAAAGPGGYLVVTTGGKVYGFNAVAAPGIAPSGAGSANAATDNDAAPTVAIAAATS